MAALHHRKDLFEAQRQRELDESKPKDIWDGNKKIDKNKKPPVLVSVLKPTPKKEAAKEPEKPGTVSASVT